MRISNTERLAERADFTLLDPKLAKDIEESLKAGNTAGVNFETSGEPLEIFRQALRG